MTTDQPQDQPTEEELRAALEAQLKQVRIEQVVTEATVSILNIAVLRAGLATGDPEDVDLAQTRVGIEAVRALLPLVEQAVGVEQAKPIRDALSQLQMAYVKGTGDEQQAAPGDAPAAPEPPKDEGPGPAQQSGRLWVPGQ